MSYLLSHYLPFLPSEWLLLRRIVRESDVRREGEQVVGS